MKCLRHPVRAVREPFGKAGLIVAMIALVFALTGAAFAAGKLTSGQKKEVEKIAKKYAGKPGAAGAAGPAGKEGPVGKEGPIGKEGPRGPQGEPGTNGTNGTNGHSVTGEAFAGTEEPAGANCGGAGGVEFNINGSSTFACNGSPWTATGALPPGKTETGIWSVGPGINAELVQVPLSFPIPLAVGAFSEMSAHFILKASEGGTTECPAEFPFELPELPPAPGNLCVYKQVIEGGSVREEPGLPIFSGVTGSGVVQESGSLFHFFTNTEAGGELHLEAKARGDWAVTAPEPATP